MKMSEEAIRTCYGFGPFRLDPLARTLVKDDKTVPLAGKAFETLLVLVENPGKVVETDALMTRVWPGVAVEENNLAQSVAAIRKALGDREREHRYIVTIAGRGYSFAAPVTQVAHTPAGGRSRRRLVRTAATAGTVAVLLAAVAKWSPQSEAVRSMVGEVLPLPGSSDGSAQIPVMRFMIGPPEKTSFVRLDGAVRSLAVAPDGGRVVFSVQSDNGNQLWLRPLDRLTAQPLPGTENGVFPFWSPDSRSIGFASRGKLRTMSVEGGPAVTLADVPNFRGATWSRDNTILFAASPGEPLRRVAAVGGSVTPASEVGGSKGEVDHLWPSFLPDGRHFLFCAVEASSAHFHIRAGSLDSHETSHVTDADSNAVYAKGYLLFLLQSTLMAQPFDAQRLKTRGVAVPLARNVGRLPTGRGSFSVSADHLLAYAANQQKQLAWFDRSGKRLSTLGDPGHLGRIHLSKDGQRAAVAVTLDNDTDIWIFDTHRGVRTRLTFGPGSESIGIWSPDGRTLVFDSNRKGHHDLYTKAADGAGSERELYADALEKGPTSWCADGKLLLYNALSPKSGWDIWALPMAPERMAAAAEARPFLRTDFNEQQAQFSPDCRWVAYTSDESGHDEIYVAHFPGGAGRQRVSPAGGSQPRWRRDGRELFYVSADGMLMSVRADAKGPFMGIGEPHPLFGPLLTPRGFAYDISPDGQQVLAEIPATGDADGRDLLTVVQNWTAGLSR